MTNDGINQYAYDAEGRVCAVYSGVAEDFTGYIYDGLGQRTAKGTIDPMKVILPLTAAACDITKNGFVTTNVYVPGSSGEQLDEGDAGTNLHNSNIYANGQLLATVTPDNNLHFALNDWLGTKRVVASASGTVEETCLSLPFGDELDYNGSDPSEQHFTGKERDIELGNDYFGARYYGSSIGRFLSPDPLQATPERLLDPQEWNMYGYARNNPLSITDPTGLDIWLQGCGTTNSPTCESNYVGTTDSDGNFSRTHLTGDQTGDASIGTNGILVTQGGNTYQGTWDTNAGEQGAVLVGGAGDLSSFNANIVGNCQGTCVASGVLQNKDGTPATADALRNALTNPDGSAKSGWFANGNDPFHRHGGTNDTSFNAMNPDTAGQRSTDVTVPQTGGSLDSRFHVNSGYPFEDAYQMTRHVISIMHTFMNPAGITDPTTQ